MYKVVTVICLLIATSTNASTTMEDYARKRGFTQCLASTKELSEFLVKTNSYGSHDVMAKKHPNENPLNSVIVKEGANKRENSSRLTQSFHFLPV